MAGTGAPRMQQTTSWITADSIDADVHQPAVRTGGRKALKNWGQHRDKPLNSNRPGGGLITSPGVGFVFLVLVFVVLGVV